MCHLIVVISMKIFRYLKKTRIFVWNKSCSVHVSFPNRHLLASLSFSVIIVTGRERGAVKTKPGERKQDCILKNKIYKKLNTYEVRFTFQLMHYQTLRKDNLSILCISYIKKKIIKSHFTLTTIIIINDKNEFMHL